MLRLLLKFHDLACLRIGIHDTEAAGFPHGNLDNRNRSIRVVLSVAFQHLRVIHLIDVVRTEEQIAAMKKSAEEFLAKVFHAMDLPVNITLEYEKENDCLGVDFAGEDMGILIGKRGQTLDSLQYLTSLVVNKDQQDYVRVKLDTENYRSRRKDTLENLARNIAYKVRKTRKPVVLEPMNPYERRIIHSALQGNKYVETYSEGTEPYRHVVVVYKKS